MFFISDSFVNYFIDISIHNNIKIIKKKRRQKISEKFSMAQKRRRWISNMVPWLKCG